MHEGQCVYPLNSALTVSDVFCFTERMKTVPLCFRGIIPFKSQISVNLRHQTVKMRPDETCRSKNTAHAQPKLTNPAQLPFLVPPRLLLLLPLCFNFSTVHFLFFALRCFANKATHIRVRSPAWSSYCPATACDRYCDPVHHMCLPAQHQQVRPGLKTKLSHTRMNKRIRTLWVFKTQLLNKLEFLVN